ncbi:MAG: EpsG family protein [Clostridia bacterium]|nr:EpsG family protein [Clostridia bacterium]
MLGYFLILFLTVFTGLNSYQINRNEKNKKYFVYFIFGMMLLFAVLRGYSVAIDYGNRVEQMEDYIFKMSFSEMIEYTGEVQDEEYLYTTFIWLVAQLFPAPWLINGMMDIFVLLTFAWFFCKYSKDVTFSVLMFVAFVFCAEMNITRQYIAAAFFLIALHLMLKKKPFHALIPMFAAVLVHVSSVLLFAVYFLYVIGFKINRKKLFLMLIVVVGAFFAFEFMIDIFIGFFPQYNYILHTWAVGDEEFSVLWLLIYSFMFICMFVSLPSSKAKTDAGELEVSGLIMISFMLYAVVNLLQSQIWFVSRINAYFIFGYCMVIPEILDRLQLEKKTKTVVTLLLKVGIAAWAILMFLQDGHGILPYEFIWETTL